MSRCAWRCAAPAGLLTLLGACAHTPHRPSTAGGPAPTVLPRNAPPVDRIPDAVPREEPRSAHGNPPFYQVDGHRYVVLASAAGYVERGVASWYGTEFHGQRTSTGEPYDMFAMTAAHKTLPLPCYARVTNLSNGHSVVVRINDRGPFVANRIIDLSYAAAVKLDMIRSGTAFVQVEALTPAAPTLTASLPVDAPAAAAAGVGIGSVPPASAVAVSAPALLENAASAGAERADTPQAAAAVTATATATATDDSGAPAPASTTASATAAPPASGSAFYIQVGAYANADNARRAAQRLRTAGLRSVFTLAADARQPLQRVRIGPISSVQQFDRLLAQLAALGFSGARLAQD